MMFFFISLLISINNILNPSDLKRKGIEEFSQKKFDESIRTFKKLDSITHNDNYESYAHYALGHIYGKEKLDPRKGISYLKKSLPYIRSKKEHFQQHQLTTYYLLADFYYTLGSIDSSEYYLKEGFNIYLDHQDDFRFPTTFIHQLSKIYYRKHEYHMSQAIHDYGLKHIKGNSQVMFLNKLSNHVKLNDSTGIEETIQLINKNFDEAKLSGNQYYHLSIYTFNQKKYHETVKYLKSFLKSYDQYFKNSDDSFYSRDEILLRNFYIARAHLKLSECYKHLDKPKEQLSSLTTALEYYKKGKSSPHIDITSIGLEIFRSLEDYNKIHDINYDVNYLDSAQQIINEEFSVRSDTNEIMKYELMIQNYYKGKYADRLEKKKKYYWKSYEYFHDFIWQQQKDDDLLFHFEELNTMQDEWIKFFSQSYIKDKNFDDLAKALEIIENAKSNILKKRSSGLIDPDFMTYIKSDFLISDKNNQKSVSPKFTSKDLKKYFEDNYDDKSFISFYYTKNNFYRITFNEGQFDLNVIKYDDTTLDKLIEVFSKSNYFISRDFIEQLDKFGKYVLPDWVNSTDNKRLVISPYGKLNSIPFEVLIFNDKYLLESFATTYSYSIHYSKNNLQKNTIYDEVNTFAIAPFANSDLQYTEEEVKDINADYLLNQEATYNSLQKALQNKKYNVLHFATHSIFKSIPQDSYISLYPDKSTKSRITFDEISNINLQHINLVVLSSCQSGVGAFSKGEGDLSLQRAFAYADIPSVIAGKWKVNDKSSAIIINNFYNYLSEGWEKDIALQKAKLLYIENNEHMYYNPMFWGGLVLNGNNNALVPPSIETRVRKLFH